MNRLKMAVLFGGPSEEHAISVKSAQQVAQHLDLAKYEPLYLGITKDGDWTLCDEPAALADQTARNHRAVLSPDRSIHGLLVLENAHYQTIRVDVVFPVLHGRFGEDGAIQGLLELSGIPYVGCDVQSSALCMDKSLTYLVARQAGISTPNFLTLNAHQTVDGDGLSYPAFVKPARSGSSFGVSQIHSPDELPTALEMARQYDSKILIEEAVVGREVGCAVLGNDPDLMVGEVDQIRLSHGFFRIHQEENPESGSDNSTVIVPADISPQARARVQETAKTLYRALGCEGLARVDMFLTDDGTVMLNEVNTLPGLTSYSRYPRMMKASGWSYADVVDRLVTMALRRGGRR
ncbi:MAG: D-alanine--(R)-lactate ligase [Sulfobacillus acidophilus]|uniref:D-alanine--D-alanine ligase n=1 Tax=Sulfobacillus acidophilus TaxID=53633 RepID=A0A2T2WDB9_9FIRM|nr:MAG: D-alanine--(R)-lactate ligase [Sulfobacillus acidophilus]